MNPFPDVTNCLYHGEFPGNFNFEIHLKYHQASQYSKKQTP